MRPNPTETEVNTPEKQEAKLFKGNLVFRWKKQKQPKLTETDHLSSNSISSAVVAAKSFSLIYILAS